jgi:deoxycytidine triphosphate deaminase
MIVNPQKLIDQGIVVVSEFSKCQQNGIDLSLREQLTLEPKQCKNIFLNERIALPDGLCGELKIRSTYSRQGVFLSSGLWDSGFQGNLGCTLYNMSDQVITIPANERVCQLVCSEADSAGIYNGRYQNS